MCADECRSVFRFLVRVSLSVPLGCGFPALGASVPRPCHPCDPPDLHEMNRTDGRAGARTNNHSSRAHAPGWQQQQSARRATNHVVSRTGRRVVLDSRRDLQFSAFAVQCVRKRLLRGTGSRNPKRERGSATSRKRAESLADAASYFSKARAIERSLPGAPEFSG